MKELLECDVPDGYIAIDHARYNQYWVLIFSNSKDLIPYYVNLETLEHGVIEPNFYKIMEK